MKTPPLPLVRQAGAHWLGRQLLAASVVLLALLLAGCAHTHSSSSAPRAGSGIAEYRQLTADATREVLHALTCLDRVEGQTNSCPSKITAALAQEVDRLQVESLRVRARAQAIQARGEAYFEAWSNELTPTNGPALGQAAEHLPRMQKSFATIKRASQQAGESFRPFLAHLRQLRTALESNAEVMGTVEGKELVLTTRVRGEEVVHYLGVITKELEVLAQEFQAAKPINL